MGIFNSLKLPKIEFLDMEFDSILIGELTNYIKLRNPKETFMYVVTPNVDHIIRYQKYPIKLSPLYLGAMLCLCDSTILHILARLVGRKLPVVCGSDLTSILFQDIITKDDTISIIGGNKDSRAYLMDRYGVKRVDYYQPPIGFFDNEYEITKCVDFIIEHPARFCFFAVGSPQQEIIAHDVFKSGKATGLGFCIGASIDFLSGDAVRAPQWMRKMGFEWLHRLLHNPVRLWKRYLITGPKIFLIYITWILRHL